MDLSGWNHYKHHAEEGPFISAAEVGGPDRVLLVGYDSQRQDFIVRLTSEGTEIEIENGEQWEAAPRWPAEMLVPDKRVSARNTDLSFAVILKEHGITPAFNDLPTENQPA
jgi:hypothetical protein